MHKKIINQKFSNHQKANEEKQNKLTEFMFANIKSAKNHMDHILPYTLT